MFDVKEVLDRVQSLPPEGEMIFSSHLFILGSRLIFAQEIFDWTDNYSETLQTAEDSPEAQRALDAISTLWIEYATMEQNLRQWKKVVMVYDDALNDPVASKASRIYRSYAEFCKSRGKISNAQKVYIRGLSAGLSEEQSDLIWKDFLLTMRENGSPDLTVEQLYAAVSSQIESQSVSKPSINFCQSVQIDSFSHQDEPAVKRTKLADISNEIAASANDSFISPASRLSQLLDKETDKVNAEFERLPLLRDLHDVSSIMVNDILSLHTCRPTMLFRSLNPENLKVSTFFIYMITKI